MENLSSIFASQSNDKDDLLSKYKSDDQSYGNVHGGGFLSHEPTTHKSIFDSVKTPTETENLFMNSKSAFDNVAYDANDTGMNGAYEQKGSITNILNVKAHNSSSGSVSIVDRMRGQLAKRLDNDLGEVSIAEMYNDSSLDTRVGNGMYNITITDIYKDEKLYMGYHGLNTDGKIEDNDKSLIHIESSIGLESVLLGDKIKDKQDQQGQQGQQGQQSNFSEMGKISFENQWNKKNSWDEDEEEDENGNILKNGSAKISTIWKTSLVDRAKSETGNLIAIYSSAKEKVQGGDKNSFTISSMENEWEKKSLWEKEDSEEDEDNKDSSLKTQISSIVGSTGFLLSTDKGSIDNSTKRITPQEAIMNNGNKVQITDENSNGIFASKNSGDINSVNYDSYIDSKIYGDDFILNRYGYINIKISTLSLHELIEVRKLSLEEKNTSDNHDLLELIHDKVSREIIRKSF